MENFSQPRFPLATVKVLDCKKFSEEMDGRVLPELEACRTDGWSGVKGNFCQVRGLRQARRGEGYVHWVYYKAEDFIKCRERGFEGKSYGTVAVSIGFTQSEIRFSELAWYFLRHGLNVLIVEHRGHGLSSRETEDLECVRVTDWNDYVKDFAKALGDARGRMGDSLPLFLFAHSMGGAIGAALEERFPKLFLRAALSSPMILPKMSGPAPVMRFLAAMMCRMGKAGEKVSGSRGFDPEAAKAGKTPSYRVRNEWYYDKRGPDPLMHLSYPCYSWSREALKMDKEISKRRSVRKISTPTILFQAERDSLVDLKAQNRFVARARRLKVPIWLCKVPKSRHEIFCAPNEILSKYLSIVLRFYFSALRDAEKIE